MAGEGEALVMCGDKSMRIGITMLDMDTGENLLHIPSCASPPFGLFCLRNQFLVASQINKHGPVGGGSIVVWPLNKPQRPLVNYTVEPIGPLSSTKDGIYLVGGALSGNAYLWNVTSGKLLKTWCAHNKSINHTLFSDDNSFLISSSDDGMICIWLMISLLDDEQIGSSTSLLHCLSGHTSSITGLLTTPYNCSSILISSSLDGTCKVWDFITGSLMQTQVYPVAITSSALHQGESLLFYGTQNGTIIVHKLGVSLEESPSIITTGYPPKLNGHNGAITSLTTSHTCLISASEDCMICIWNVISGTIIRRFNHQKGKITNLVVVQRLWVLSTSKHKRVSNQYVVSLLDKYPQSVNSSSGNTTPLSLRRLHNEKQTCTDLQSTGLCTGLLRQNMSDSQKAHMHRSMDMQMKMETSIKNLLWATEMTKHVMAMNSQLQSQLLGLMQQRLIYPNRINSKKTSRKKPKIQSLLHEEENHKP